MRYILLIIVLLFPMGCTSSDLDASVQVVAWLQSLDPSAQVIEVRCTGNVEDPPHSGNWKTLEQTERWSANEVLKVYAKKGLDWEEIVERAADAIGADFPRWALDHISPNLGPVDRMVIKLNLQIDDLHCEGKPLRSPSIQIGKCPNDTKGCDEPPMTTDLPPPLPPPPPPGG
jgi:hypothetical protein